MKMIGGLRRLSVVIQRHKIILRISLVASGSLRARGGPRTSAEGGQGEGAGRPGAPARPGSQGCSQRRPDRAAGQQRMPHEQVEAKVNQDWKKLSFNARNPKAAVPGFSSAHSPEPDSRLAEAPPIRPNPKPHRDSGDSGSIRPLQQGLRNALACCQSGSARLASLHQPFM